MTKSTYVTVGRNIGDEPMSADLWLDFRMDVEIALDTHVGPVVTTAEGTGYWVGGSEDTVVVVAVEQWPKPGLRDELRRLARRYGQEAIAVAVAEVEFVKGTEDR